MAKAFLALTDGTHKVIEPDKAVDIWLTLNGHKEPTEEQSAFLSNIKDVFIPPSYRSRATGYMQAHGLTPDGHKVTLKQELTNPGVLQGMAEIMPRNDR